MFGWQTNYVLNNQQIMPTQAQLNLHKVVLSTSSFESFSPKTKEQSTNYNFQEKPQTK